MKGCSRKGYLRYFKGIEPPIKRAISIGKEFDYMVKVYYVNKPRFKEVQTSDIIPTLISSRFKDLSEVDQAILFAMVDAYLVKYKDEYFHDVKVPEPMIYNANEHFNIIVRPDLVALNYLNEPWIIELKTGDIENVYTFPSFQEEIYAFIRYKWEWQFSDILRRVVKKPRIKQKKNQSMTDYKLEIFKEYHTKPDKYIQVFATTYSANDFLTHKKEFLQSFEEELKEMLDQCWFCFNRGTDKAFIKREDMCYKYGECYYKGKWCR